MSLAASLALFSLAHAFYTDPDAYSNSSETPYMDLTSAPALKPPELLFSKNNVDELMDGHLFISLYGNLSSDQSVPSIYG